MSAQIEAASELLESKIAARKALIGIIGAGYGGLSLGLASGRMGFKVLGFDMTPEKVVDA